MDKTTKKENRGGAREGAGRKGLGNTKRVSICLTDELVPVFKQLGGAKWLRCCLDAFPRPEEHQHAGSAPACHGRLARICGRDHGWYRDLLRRSGHC